MLTPAGKRVVLGLVAVAALGGLAGWWITRPKSEEDRVRAVFADLEAKVEDKDASGVLEHISERYRAEGLDRNLDKKGLHPLLVYYFLHHKEVAVEIRDLEVRVLKGDKVAQATLRARFAEGDVRAALGGEEWLFEVDLEREDDGEWRVMSHRRSAGTP